MTDLCASCTKHGNGCPLEPVGDVPRCVEYCDRRVYFFAAACWIEGASLCRPAAPGEGQQPVKVEGRLADEQPPGMPGSVWVNPDGPNLHYIDEAGATRRFALADAVAQGFIFERDA